ncbi:MAG: hypothetical protein R3358_09445 [Woeseiaceae bacterium]|nr:hypothetical protein [Woeseiaceae bacterium]
METTMRRLKSLFLITIFATLAGCAAMMMGGGGGSTYPVECPDGQRSSEKGCKE